MIFISALPVYSEADVLISPDFILYSPATLGSIEDAKDNGLVIKIKGSIEADNGIVYGLLDNTDASKFCLYKNRINMTLSFHEQAYSTLYGKGENVALDYNWPFNTNTSQEERWSSYSDGYGDMVGGLLNYKPLDSGLVVCRNKLF